MTPKEKAVELALKFRQIPPFSPYTGIGDEEAKQCALLTVAEIFYVLPDIQELWQYWYQVKQEIENL